MHCRKHVATVTATQGPPSCLRHRATTPKRQYPAKQCVCPANASAQPSAPFIDIDECPFAIDTLSAYKVSSLLAPGASIFAAGGTVAGVGEDHGSLAAERAGSADGGCVIADGCRR